MLILNEIVIKNALVQKIKLFLVYMEGFHLPHNQVSLREDRSLRH